MEELSASERRSMIAQMVAEKGKVLLSDLVEKFQITETSIRRDLTILEEEGLLKRVHGGAVPMAGYSRTDSFNEKKELHNQAKERIGKAAAALINPRDVVIFDSGTTTLQIAKQMPLEFRQNGAITIVTNSLPIVQEVNSWPSPNVILLGGIYMPDYQATIGPQTIAQLKQLKADKVFLGVDGLTIDNGVSTGNILMGEVDRLMASSSRKVIIVTDSSKFGRFGFVPVIPINAIHTIITDTDAPPELVDSVRAQGIEVILV